MDFGGLSNYLLPALAQAPSLHHCELQGWLPGCALRQLSQLPPSLASLTAFIKVPPSPLLDLLHLPAGRVWLIPLTAYQPADAVRFALSLPTPTCPMTA